VTCPPVYRSYILVSANSAVPGYVWLRDLDFVVLMKKYSNGGRRLITSFYVDHPHAESRYAFCAFLSRRTAECPARYS